MKHSQKKSKPLGDHFRPSIDGYAAAVRCDHLGGKLPLAAVGAKVRYRTERSELNKYFSTVPSASGIFLCAAETGVKLGAKDVSELLFPTSKAPIAPQLNSQTHWSVS